MKGISLPINAVIFLLVAALVLSLVTVFFINSSGQSTASLNHAESWARGCSIAKATGCSQQLFSTSTNGIIINGYDPEGDDGDTNCVSTSILKPECKDNGLTGACKRFFGETRDESDTAFQQECRNRCCG